MSSSNLDDMNVPCDDKQVRKAKFYKNKAFEYTKELKQCKSNKKRASCADARSFKKFHGVEYQMGMEIPFFTSYVNSLAASRGLQIGSETARIIEGLGLLFLNISGATTITQVVSGVGLYARDFCPMSMTEKLCSYAITMLSDKVVTQSSLEPKPAWLDLIRDAKDKWRTIVDCEGFRKISHLLSLALGAGLCHSSNIEFSIAGLQLFSVGAMKKHVDAISLIDAAVDTLYFFVEGGYQCFRSGSLRPLLYADSEAMELEDSYFDTLDKAQYARTGDLQSKFSMDDSDLDKQFEEVIDRHRVIGQTCSKLDLRTVLRRRMEELQRIHLDFSQRRNMCALREAPFCLNLYGTTSVGKSTLAKLLICTVLKFNGFDASNDRIVTIKETDKFLSTYKAHTNAVILDDLGNTNEKFVERAPTDRIIEFCNNTPQYADKADLAEKGKVALVPKMVLVTTNDKTMGARTYSNEPASIMRRAHFTITAKVKEQFALTGMLDSSKVEHYYLNTLKMDEVPAIIDVWDMTVETVSRKVSSSGQKDGVTYHVVDWITENGIVPLQDVSIKSVICFLQDYSKKYFASQKRFVAVANNLVNNLDFCGKCGRPAACCNCLEQQFGAVLAKSVTTIGTKYCAALMSQKTPFEYRLETAANKALLKSVKWFESSPYVCWVNWIPSQWLDNTYLRQAILFGAADEIQMQIRFMCFFMCVFTVMFYYNGWTSTAKTIGFVFCFCYPYYVKCIREQVLKTLIKRNGLMPEVFKSWRDSHMTYLLNTSAVLASFWALAQIWKHSKLIPATQGSLSPTTEVEVEERNAEKNVWAGYVIEPLPVSEEARTTTAENLRNMVEKNLCCMEFYIGGAAHFVDAFFIKSNVALVPDHIFRQSEIYAVFTKHGIDKVGGNFKCHLSASTSYKIPDTDLRLVWVPSGGDWRDLTPYYPLEELTRSMPGYFSYKRGDGEISRSGLLFKPEMIDCVDHHYRGGSYDLDFPTFPGLCMGTIVSQTRAPLIIGHHLGGKTDATYGVAGTITQPILTLAFAELARKNVLLCASAGTLPENQYGIRYFEGAEVHFKSPINYLEGGGSAEIYGSVTGRSTYNSEVKETKISPLVTEITGTENMWGKPQMKPAWKPFQIALSVSSKPSGGIEPLLMDLALRDYTDHMIKKIDKFSKTKRTIFPLTDMQTVCGVDGLKFIDKMPPNTSVGFPLSGAKSKFLTDLDPKDYPGFSCPRELDPMFFEELAAYEKLWLDGKRAYPIFKGCLKDEPTKLGKEKVRVFQAAPIALQLAVRKYFLPIARVLSMFPLDSECAVGVNAHGPEWQELSVHMKTFGEERIIAGDYKSYDLRMPAQIVLMAFKAMILIAKHCGYTDYQITIMEGIATEIAYPIVAYNGDLLKLVGSHPTGQGLTVYVNGIGNSMFIRCFYFSQYGASAPPFRKVCALATYGDDFKGSVKKDYDKLNHVGFADWLAEHDTILTMPDKESTPIPYLPDSQADFLKRKNVYSEKTGFIMGALDEASIFKSLHSCIKSKVISDDEHDMQAIDGALREWFMHGEEMYERRRLQMNELAERAGIAHGCTGLHLTYDDKVALWKEKYIPEQQGPELPPTVVPPCVEDAR